MIYVLALLAIVQPTIVRFKAAFIFTSITALHGLLLSDSTGMLYYLSAAFFDLVIIALIFAIKDPIITRLQRICILSISTNLVGWVMWFLYYPPIFYNLVFVCIYIWSAFVLLTKDGSCDGHYSFIRWNSRDYRNWCPGFFDLFKQKGSG